MGENKRNLFVTSRIRNYFIFYVLFSILTAALFLGWEVFIEIIISALPESSTAFNPLRSFPTVIKVSLLLLWGMFSFLLAYTYLDAKFLGIFSRMDELFRRMLEDDSLTLQFRKHDTFDFLAESFNRMHRMFQDRIRHRRELLNELGEKIEKLPEDPPREVLNEIVSEIDRELSKPS